MQYGHRVQRSKSWSRGERLPLSPARPWSSLPGADAAGRRGAAVRSMARGAGGAAAAPCPPAWPSPWGGEPFFMTASTTSRICFKGCIFHRRLLYGWPDPGAQRVDALQHLLEAAPSCHSGARVHTPPPTPPFGLPPAVSPQ